MARCSTVGDDVDRSEIHKLAELEDTHWWYRERRHLLARSIAALRPGRALDIGAAAGGNTRVLRSHGWQAVALEYGTEGTVIARERGIPVIRADATRLPVTSGSLDLVVAFDVLEHIADDEKAAAEIRRVLRPGGCALIAVPAGPRLWSAHDEAVGHVRRYTRSSLLPLLEDAGLSVEEVRSWNVLLRPVAAWRRRTSTGSDLDDLPPAVNGGLRLIIALERWLPVGGLPGVSLLVRAWR